VKPRQSQCPNHRWGSSSEVNSPVSFATAENTGEKKSKNSTKPWETSTYEEQRIKHILVKRTSSPEAVASPAIYTNYASSSLKQQKKTMIQTMQQLTRKSTNQGATAKRKRRKSTSPPESGELLCQLSIMVQRYPPTQEDKS
jgi:hypothetical protein